MQIVARYRAWHRKVRLDPRAWRRKGGKLFWAWVIYQAVKGTLTLSLIWIPLFLLWLNQSGGQ
jgi:hypothetical protein